MERGADLTVKLICVFVFAYAKCWFSHKAAHLISFTLPESNAFNGVSIFDLVLDISERTSPLRQLPTATSAYVHMKWYM